MVLQDGPEASPVVGPDGTLYLASNGGTEDKPRGAVLALDAATGRRKWRFPLADWPTRPSGVGPDGAVYVRTYASQVLALDARTGKKRWQIRHMAGEAAAAPSLGPDNALYLASWDGGPFIAVDSRTGAKLWTLGDYWLQPPCAPAVAPDGTVYIAAVEVQQERQPQEAAYLAAFDGRTGRIRWRIPLGETWRLEVSPAVGPDGLVFATADYDGVKDNLLAVDAATGKLSWSRKTRAAGLAAARGVLYVAGDGVSALEARTGRPLWHADVREPSGPALHGSTLCVGSSDHRLHALNARTGALRWYFDTGAPVSAPTIGPDGTVYVAGGSSVFAVSPGTSPSAAPETRSR